MSTAFERRTFPEGAVLFREGDAADHVYMVESGLVDLVVRQPDGGSLRLGTVGPGEILGEMALIDDKPRMATARVAMEARLVCIPPEAFKAQLRTVNPVMTRILTQLVKRLRAVSHDLALAQSKPRP